MEIQSDIEIQSTSAFGLFDAKCRLGRYQGSPALSYHAIASLGAFPCSRTIFLYGKDRPLALL